MPEFEFSSEGVDRASSFDVLPAGKYAVIISASDVKQTAKGGEYIKLEMTVIDGPHMRRKLFTNINVKNPNPEAARIGRGQLASLCDAIGVQGIRHTEELHDKPLMVNVKVKNDPTYGPSNDVKGFSKYGESSAPATPKPSVAAAAAPAANGKPPFQTASLPWWAK